MIAPDMICGNINLNDRFKCPFHPRTLQCKRIDWWTCRNYQNGNHSPMPEPETLGE
jgi:hypothetical protein